MRNFALMIMLAAIVAPPLRAATPDEEAIKRTALDYIEGWYDGDAKRMERALHPELVKRILVIDPKTQRPRISGQGASELIARTDSGIGKNTPRDKVRKDVTVLDVFGNAATARVIATDWVDYLHLVKWNGEWKIINVLWERNPEPAK